MKKDLPTDRVILGILLEKPMHGYDVCSIFENRFGGIWNTSTSQIYNLLRRMEKAGDLTSKIEGDKLPGKKVFYITERGIRKFKEWVSSPVESMRRLRVELPVKMFFLIHLGMGGIDDLLEKQKDICLGKLKEIEKKKCRDLFTKITMDFKTHHIKATIDWIDRMKEELKSP